MTERIWIFWLRAPLFYGVLLYNKQILLIFTFIKTTSKDDAVSDHGKRNSETREGRETKE